MSSPLIIISVVICFIILAVAGFVGYSIYSGVTGFLSNPLAAVLGKGLICPPGREQRGLLCYEKCPDGWRSDGTHTCYQDGPKDWKGKSTLTHLQHHTIYSSVGADPKKSIPTGCAGNKVNYLGLCYELPDDNWFVSSAGLIREKCKKGYRDVAGVCWKEKYGVGVGTADKKGCWNRNNCGNNGDGVASNPDNQWRCKGSFPYGDCDPKDKAEGKENNGCGSLKDWQGCDSVAGLWYPKCKPGWTRIHSEPYNCQYGYDGSIIGASYVPTTKPARPPGVFPDKCPTDDRELHNRLCYPKCPAGYERTGGNIEMCQTICPPGFKNIGIGGCEKPRKMVNAKGITEVGVCPKDAPVRKGDLCHKS